MTRRAALCLTVLLPMALLLTGCAALQPNHVTVMVGRDEAEAETAPDRRTRTVTTRVGLSATYDLPR